MAFLKTDSSECFLSIDGIGLLLIDDSEVSTAPRYTGGFNVFTRYQTDEEKRKKRIEMGIIKK